MCPCLDRTRYFLLISASKDAYVASDSQFCQGALDDAGPGFFFLSQSSTSCSSLAFSFGFRLRLHSAIYASLDAEINKK